MAFTQRNRRVAYDNIAAGSATGLERTIAGETVSKLEMYGGGFTVDTSTGDTWHTNIAAGSSVTDGNDPDNEPSQSSFSGTNGAINGTNTTDPTDELP